jgi:hypothetical protein
MSFTLIQRPDLSFRIQGREEEAEGRALSQIKEKKYADKYRSLRQPIHLIGVEFSKKARHVVEFEVGKIEATAVN